MNANGGVIDFRQLANRAQLWSGQDDLRIVSKFGQNIDIDTADTEDIWRAGGNKVYLDTADTLEIASTSVNDTSAGTGARSVFITGLDGDYNDVSELVFLNGTSSVTTVNEYIDIQRLVVFQAGDLEFNEGDITATSTTGAVLVAQIAAEDSITQQSHYTVPAGYTGFITTETLSVYKADGTGTRQGEISLLVKGSGQTAWVKSYVRGVNSATTQKNWDIPVILPEKTRIKYRGKAATNNTAMSVTYEILLIKNTELAK